MAGFGGYRVTPDTSVRPPQQEPFRPTYSVPAAVHEDLRTVERLDQRLRDAVLEPDLARRILREALIRNAHGTASIEGNPLSLEEVESLLAVGPTPENLVVPTEREVLNWTAWMDALPEHGFPRTPVDVAALHATLFRGVLSDAGAFKRHPNFVGRAWDRTVVYVPTPPERVEAELTAALRWLWEADEHPLVRGLVFFHEFEAIHPFRDGNGRLGRALMTLWLHRAGYPGIRYAHVDATFNQERDAYYTALSDAERGGWDRTPWLVYMAAVLRETFEDALHRFLFLQGLPTDLNDRRLDLARWFRRMDRARTGCRLKVADVHAAMPHVPRRTLQADLRALVDHGVLVRDGVGKGTTYRFAA